MPNLLLGIRKSVRETQRIKIEEIDFEMNIQNFKIEVCKKAELLPESIELVYCGNVLEDEKTLTESGLKPGVMVHVLKKKVKEAESQTPPMNEASIEALVLAFKTFTLHPSCRSSLQKLSRPDILENLINATPGLRNDPVALALIQDPELVLKMGDIESIRRIVKFHPALAEAAHHIAAVVHEEAVSGTQPSTSSGLASLVDMYSDEMEDDMESSQSSDSVQIQGVTRQPYSTITSAQLAAALASASQGPGTSNQTDNSAITPEMVNEAMQRAVASVINYGNSSSSSNQTSETNNYVDQMRQMRELGLTDDIVNLQALQVAGGNVHAAVDLVFSGAITGNN